MKVIKYLQEIFKANRQQVKVEKKLLKILKGAKRHKVYISEKQIDILRHLAEIGITDIEHLKQYLNQ